MKYKIRNIQGLSLAAILMVCLFAACQKNNDLGTPDRLFRPVINQTNYGGTWILYQWDKFSNVDHYELQLSTDSFVTFVAEIQTDTNFYKFDNLQYDTNYYLRIKSVGSNLESRYFVNDVIKTSDFPTKLNSVSPSDVIDTQVRITWGDATYDSLQVYTGNTLVKSVVLTAADNAARQKIIKSLSPQTIYIVKAYSDGGYQGKKSFNTAAPQIFVGDVVDLRDYSDTASYSMLNQAFFDQLAVDHPNGVTVVLSGGTHYELSGSLMVKSDFTLVTGYSLGGKAVFEVNGNFNLDAGIVIGNIRLEKLAFTDHPSSPRTGSNYGARYIFNINGAGSSIDSLSMEDCDVRYKRGIVRIQTAATLKSISINNCFMDSIAGYGIVNYDNSGVTANSVSVTNSTFAHCEVFLRNDKMTTALENLKVSNITTYHTPKDYFFRMGTINNVEITNCLFGSVWNPTTGAQGLSATVTTSAIQNNFRTSDCVWTALLDAGGSVIGDKNPIESTQMTESSDQIFGNSSANDYTVTDPRLKGKIGDPRWW